MKIICLDLDNCAFFRKLLDEELKNYDLTQPFLKCEECNNTALIVKDQIENNNQSLTIKNYQQLIRNE